MSALLDEYRIKSRELDRRARECYRLGLRPLDDDIWLAISADLRRMRGGR